MTTYAVLFVSVNNCSSDVLTPKEPLFIGGVKMPPKPATKKSVFGLFKKTPSDVATAKARDELRKF